MHRSSSASRLSGQFFINSSPSQSHSSRHPNHAHHHQQNHHLLLQHERLPTFDPLSHAAKKEMSRVRSAENAIHVIPLVLVLCALILWFFSNTGLDPSAGHWCMNLSCHLLSSSTVNVGLV